MDARTLAFAPASFDVVASTALLEHIDGVDAAMREMARVVRPGGVVFANFGPLYYTYGGAHYDGAYEHLAMSDAELERYLVQRNIPGELEDGLVWVRNGMFSKLRYDEYLAIFERYFHLEHVTLAVSPPAMRFRRERPSEWRYLTARYDEADLLTYAMTVWLRPLPVALSSRRRQRGAAA
jgi:ubiquinone/menaquinone biosynthesis C-methylase UbiE